MRAPESRQLCTFFVDGALFGVDVRCVQEVIRGLPTTPVPLAPAVVLGLINLRGRIVTAIDLRRRLGLSARPSDEAPMNLIARHDEGVVSLLVDEIGDVVEVDETSFEPPPAMLRLRCRDVVKGVYKLEKQLLLLLDTEHAMRVDARTPGEESDHV